MDVMISISDVVASKLKERAGTSGQTVPVCATRPVAETITKPTVDEILAPFRKQVVESGMSDDELSDFLRGELEAHRQEKRAKSA